MGEIINYIMENYQNVKDIVTLLATVFSAIFGGLSYRTAKRIYKNGIQNDCKSIYAQLGLEIVWNIIIPFEKIEKYMKSLLEEQNLEQEKVEIVYKMLELYKFKLNTPYWNLHKGEIWDAIEKDNDKKSIWRDRKKLKEEDTRFIKIQIFFERAEEFNKGVQRICNSMENYMYPKEVDGSENSELIKERKNETMEALFKNVESARMYYQKSEDKIKELNDAISQLPLELDIKGKYRKITERL